MGATHRTRPVWRRSAHRRARILITLKVRMSLSRPGLQDVPRWESRRVRALPKIKSLQLSNELQHWDDSPLIKVNISEGAGRQRAPGPFRVAAQPRPSSRARAWAGCAEPPTWGYGGDVNALRRSLESRSPRSPCIGAGLSRESSGEIPGKPLTAGGGARNISPCAADGRKRPTGARRPPGTLKTGY